MQNWKLSAAAIVRKITRSFPIRRKLPADLGGAWINVSSSSDVRLLSPKLETSAGDLFQIARSFISPGDVVWDIGANLGLFTFPAAARAGVNGAVYALEADSRHVELMHRTRSDLNRDYAPVTILCAAAADLHSLVNLNVVSKGHSRNFLDSVGGNDPGDIAEIKTVVSLPADWLLEHWRPPAFVKVDIEGAEMLFLKGASKLLKNVKPLIYIEVNDENQEAATLFLHDAGYLLFSPDEVEREKALPRCGFNTMAVPTSHKLLNR